MATREQPQLTQPEKSLCSSEDSAQPKIKKKKTKQHGIRVFVFKQTIKKTKQKTKNTSLKKRSHPYLPSHRVTMAQFLIQMVYI